MKKGLIGLLIAAAVILGLFVWVKNTYNGLVTADEGVKAAWSQVENVYQRRADLIPNLVATVKGYASHESSTLEAVIEARAKATQVTVDPDKLTEENIAAFQSAQGELGNAIGRLLVSVEQYPDLKANQNFLELQARRTGLQWNVRSSTILPRHITPRSAVSRQILSLQCSISNRKAISRLQRAHRPPRKWSSDNNLKI